MYYNDCGYRNEGIALAIAVSILIFATIITMLYVSFGDGFAYLGILSPLMAYILHKSILLAKGR